MKIIEIYSPKPIEAEIVRGLFTIADNEYTRVQYGGSQLRHMYMTLYK